MSLPGRVGHGVAGPNIFLSGTPRVIAVIRFHSVPPKAELSSNMNHIRLDVL